MDRNTKPILIEQIPLQQPLWELESSLWGNREVWATPGASGHHHLGMPVTARTATTLESGERLTLQSQTGPNHGSQNSVTGWLGQVISLSIRFLIDF